MEDASFERTVRALPADLNTSYKAAVRLIEERERLSRLQGRVHRMGTPGQRHSADAAGGSTLPASDEDE